MNEDLNEHGFPKDWAEQHGFHGFSRANLIRRYVVKLSVLATQFNIGVATNQKEAAKLYDLALWKLAAFISRTLKPNFPENFLGLTDADALACPVLAEIYAQCAAAANLDGTLTERELREKALAPKVFEVPSNSADYGKYQKLVDKTRANALLTMTRLSQVRMMLNFTKFPELQRVAAGYEKALDDAERQGRELQSLLTSHTDIYKKLLDDKHTAI